MPLPWVLPFLDIIPFKIVFWPFIETKYWNIKIVLLCKKQSNVPSYYTAIFAAGLYIVLLSIWILFNKYTSIFEVASLLLMSMHLLISVVNWGHFTYVTLNNLQWRTRLSTRHSHPSLSAGVQVVNCEMLEKTWEHSAFYSWEHSASYSSEQLLASSSRTKDWMWRSLWSQVLTLT